MPKGQKSNFLDSQDSCFSGFAGEGWSALKFYPHVILFPGLAIFLTMLAFNLLGDQLRDALDPTAGSHGSS